MAKIVRKKVILLLAILFVILQCFGFIDEVPLGNGFTFFGDGPVFISYRKKGDTLSFDIPPDVLAYKNTRRNLLVMHYPAPYDHPMFTSYVYPHGRDTTYYFFIDKKSKEVTGPLLYSEMVDFLKGKNLEEMMIKGFKNVRKIKR